MTADPTFWILARASGLLAYGLLTAAMLAGLVLRARPFGRALRPAACLTGSPAGAARALLLLRLSRP